MTQSTRPPAGQPAQPPSPPEPVRPVKPPAYPSPQAKSRFLRIALSLAIVCFVGRWIVPKVAAWFLSPVKHAIMKTEVAAHQVNNAAVWDGRVWYAQNVAGLSAGLKTQLVAMPLTGDRLPVVVAALEAGEPWMLAGEDRLWIVWAGGTAWFRGGQVHAVDSAAPPKDTSRPFLYEGRPALIQQVDDRARLIAFDGRTWQDQAGLALPFAPPAGGWGEQMRVIRHKGEYHLFCRPFLDARVYHRRGMPGAEDADRADWEEVTRAGGQWKAVSAGDGLAVFLHDADTPNGPWLAGLKPGDDGWAEFFRHKIGLDIGLGACWTGPEGEVVLLRRVLPLGATVMGVAGGKVAWESDASGKIALPEGMRWRAIVLRILPLLFPLAFVLAMGPVMARHRITVHVAEGRQAAYAPLWRRSAAAVIDLLVVAAPIVAFGWHTFRRVAQADDLTLWKVVTAILSVACVAIPWLILAFFLTALLEGRWGVTPGKAALGLRVRRATLQRCGFGWALLRNLIKPVDMLFHGMVGLILAAFTSRWQRLGDMAAGTVVVRPANLRGDAAGPDSPDDHSSCTMQRPLAASTQGSIDTMDGGRQACDA